MSSRAFRSADPGQSSLAQALVQATISLEENANGSSFVRFHFPMAEPKSSKHGKRTIKNTGHTVRCKH